MTSGSHCPAIDQLEAGVALTPHAIRVVATAAAPCLRQARRSSILAHQPARDP
jgi:hypothetical protein